MKFKHRTFDNSHYKNGSCTPAFEKPYSNRDVCKCAEVGGLIFLSNIFTLWLLKNFLLLMLERLCV